MHAARHSTGGMQTKKGCFNASVQETRAGGEVVPGPDLPMEQRRSAAGARQALHSLGVWSNRILLQLALMFIDKLGGAAGQRLADDLPSRQVAGPVLRGYVTLVVLAQASVYYL